MSAKKILSSKDEVNKFSGNIVTILVGKDQEARSVHQKLICASSSFFEKTVAEKCEGTSMPVIMIEMPNDEPKIFAIYIHWLYSGTIPVSCGDSEVSTDEDARNNDTDDNADENADESSGESSDDDTVSDNEDEYLDLAKAYVLGENILDPRFQNAAIDAIIEKSMTKDLDGHSYFPDEDTVKYTYNSTSKSAPIRRLLVDMYAQEGDSTWIDASEWPDSGVPHPFILGLASRLFQNKRQVSRPLRPLDYHARGLAEVENES